MCNVVVCCYRVAPEPFRAIGSDTPMRRPAGFSVLPWTHVPGGVGMRGGTVRAHFRIPAPCSAAAQYGACNLAELRRVHDLVP